MHILNLRTQKDIPDCRRMLANQGLVVPTRPFFSQMQSTRIAMVQTPNNRSALNCAAIKKQKEVLPVSCCVTDRRYWT